jgi:uncharacterized protein DUF5615
MSSSCGPTRTRPHATFGLSMGASRGQGTGGTTPRGDRPGHPRKRGRVTRGLVHADENVPLGLVEALRRLGQNVLTAVEAGQVNRAILDHEALAFATGLGRAVLTLNRWQFIGLHSKMPRHAGIVVCTQDPDLERQALLGRHGSRPRRTVRGDRAGAGAALGGPTLDTFRRALKRRLGHDRPTSAPQHGAAHPIDVE